uniref:Uncharacterized protein n=1 Tax=viral metagenome TaxID=1070528 RepID=A0A6H1ZPJ3_9ZZZZ
MAHKKSVSKKKKAGAQREANRKLHQKGNKIMADQKEDVTGNGGEKVVTPEEQAYVEDTQKLEPEVTTDMPHAAVGQAFTPPEVDCPHKTIRDWPGCFEDCDYAGMDECPHHVSYEPEIDSGMRDLEPTPKPEPFDPKSVIAKYLKK